MASIIKHWALSTTALAAASLAIASTAASAGTLTPIPDYPGATDNTSVLAINDNLEIAGGYVSSDGVEHGFYGPLGGTYTSFDIGTGGTYARAIGSDGTILAINNTDAFSSFSDVGQYEISPGGTVTQVTLGGVPAGGIVQGINSNGTFVGEVWGPSSAAGYTGTNAAYTSPITLPGISTSFVRPRSINDSNEIVGFYIGSISHGFVLEKGIAKTVNYVVTDPNLISAYGSTVTGTYLEGVNNAGLITGVWMDANYNPHAFLLSPDLTTFTDLAVPGATWEQSFGLNNSNDVVLSTDIGSFIYNPATSPGVPAGTAVFLPLPVSGGTDTFQFQFNVVTNQTYEIDPAIATGYVYKTGAGDPNFASVTPPSGVDGDLFRSHRLR